MRVEKPHLRFGFEFWSLSHRQNRTAPVIYGQRSSPLLFDQFLSTSLPSPTSAAAPRLYLLPLHKQKKTQGRKKIDIKKIDELTSRQVTFSKRRTGLFNKASELCVLTGAEAAILVESPGGRVFAFGNPSVESVMGRYLGGSSSGAPDQHQLGSNPDRTMHEEYNQKYSQISKELEAEKNKKTAMEEKKEENYWWEESIEGLGLEELENYIAAMEKLRDNLNNRAKELAMIRKSSTFDPSQNPSNNNDDVFRVDDYNYLANAPEDDLGYDFTFDDEQI